MRCGSGVGLAPADHLAVGPSGALFRRRDRDELEPGVVRQEPDELLPHRAGGAEHGDGDAAAHDDVPGQEVASQLLVQRDALLEVGLADPLVLGVRDADRAGPELVSLAPGREEGQVAGETHDGRLPSLRGGGYHARNLQRVGDADAGFEARLERALEVIVRQHGAEQELRLRVVGYDVGGAAALDAPDVERHVAEHRVRRQGDALHPLQRLQQRHDGRLALGGICRVRGATGGDEVGAEDALLPDGELVLGRLAIDEEPTARRRGSRPRQRPRTRSPHRPRKGGRSAPRPMRGGARRRRSWRRRAPSRRRCPGRGARCRPPAGR